VQFARTLSLVPWPSIAERDPERFTPGRAVTLCFRRGGAEEIPPALLEAGLLTRPCGGKCQGHHTVLWVDQGGRLHVRSSPRPVLSLADELAAVGYQRPGPRGTWPADWPTPSQYNEPLTQEAPPMTPETQRAQDEAVAAAAGREVTPHPDGLPGRIADAIAEGAEADAVGDIDTMIGADQLAAALADAAFG